MFGQDRHVAGYLVNILALLCCTSCIAHKPAASAGDAGTIDTRLIGVDGVSDRGVQNIATSQPVVAPDQTGLMNTSLTWIGGTAGAGILSLMVWLRWSGRMAKLREVAQTLRLQMLVTVIRDLIARRP